MNAVQALWSLTAWNLSCSTRASSASRIAPLDHDEPVVAFEAEASGLAHRDALAAHQVIAQEDVRLFCVSRRESEHSVHAPRQGSVRNKEFIHRPGIA